ncbi:MAG: CoA transferase [Nitrososphaerales archaeon]
MIKPLSNIRVIEFGTAIAGPMCGMLLGDMGADVIKIERPKVGDDSRHWGVLVKGESPYFLNYNRNKRSIALDIRSEEGRSIILKLVEKSDILIENFRPGVMERLKLSYNELSKINPKLIYCSVSGFGQTGPYSKLGGYDFIIQGMCGLMSVTGEPNGPPLRVGVPITDILTAIYAAFSILLALYTREKIGKGQRIDISLFESGVSSVSQWLSIYTASGIITKRFGNKYPIMAPYEPFPTKDGEILVAALNEELWSKLCKAINREDLLNDPRFKTNAERIIPENREALASILSEVFKQKTSQEWLKILWDAEIPAGPINTIDKLVDDPHLKERGDIVEIEHKTLGMIKLFGIVPKLSETKGEISKPPPLLGQHTIEILKELGYKDEDISELLKKGVIWK